VYGGLVSPPAWLPIERVLASHGLSEEARDRQEYLRYLAGRVAEERQADPQALAPQWQAMRRGWYVGSEPFQEQLSARLGAVLSGHQRESYSGPAIQGHDEQAAEARLAWALRVLGLSLAEVSARAQKDVHKQGVAWLWRTSTVISSAWVVRKLAMGHRSNVSRAVQAIGQAPSGPTHRIRSLLQPCKA
jgi:hypothetical protein